MIDSFARWGAALSLRLAGRPRRNRRRYYAGANGLRILCFHRVDGANFPRFTRLIEWCRRTFVIAGIADLDALTSGGFQDCGRDKVLLTFDDGYEHHLRIARWLSEQEIEAIFFLVPSYLDRTAAEYLRLHEENGVKAYDFTRKGAEGNSRGLSRSQVKEIHELGHRVAAHNYAHRDLGTLRDPDELGYEIGCSLDAVEELLGERCEDFAFAFGQAGSVSDEAMDWLARRCRRIFSCVRGLNIRQGSPGLLFRDPIYPEQPIAFSRLCILGGADHRLASARLELNRRFHRARLADPGAIESGLGGTGTQEPVEGGPHASLPPEDTK